MLIMDGGDIGFWGCDDIVVVFEGLYILMDGWNIFVEVFGVGCYLGVIGLFLWEFNFVVEVF